MPNLRLFHLLEERQGCDVSVRLSVTLPSLKLAELFFPSISGDESLCFSLQT